YPDGFQFGEFFKGMQGFDVVVLEASRIGFGASGRNGGQLVNSYSRDIDVIEKSYGMDTARMLGSMMFEGGEITCVPHGMLRFASSGSTLSP
ncbi:hypothetical protein ACUOFC_57280, partial [Escherichia sp. TWPC-MK]